MGRVVKKRECETMMKGTAEEGGQTVGVGGGG